MKLKNIVLKYKFALLLSALLLFFLLNPLFASPTGSFYFGILFTLVLLFCVLVITQKKSIIALGILLAALTFLGAWSGIIYKPIKTLMLIETIIASVFFFLITSVVLSTVIRDKGFTINTILGAICGYLLVGLSWSFIFLFVYYLDAQAFAFAPHVLVNKTPNLHDFIYFSFVSLTTIGYGDITPVDGYARTFAWIEAAVGQIYLTVWIAHLVAMHVATRRSKN